MILKFIARVLFASFFIISGWWSISNAQKSADSLSKAYKGTHNTLVKSSEKYFKLPEFLEPKNFEENKLEILKGLAFTQIALGGLSAVGVGRASFGLGLMMIFYIGVKCPIF